MFMGRHGHELLTPVFQIKESQDLNCLLPKPFLPPELPVEKIHLPSDHSSLGSVCKEYSNGYMI